MNSSHIRTLATDQCRFHTRIVLLGYALMVSAPAMAAEIVTMEVETQVLDLDAGTVVDTLTEELTAPTGADVQLAYNADRTPHVVVFPVGEGVELAFVVSVGFDGISSSDVSDLAFSTEPMDLPFSANDCVVIRTDQGMFFKLGNATESGLSITFNYELL